MSVPSATGTPAAWSLRRFSRRTGRLRAQVLEVRIPLRIAAGVLRRAVPGQSLAREAVRRRGIREHRVHEAPRVGQELEDVHRRNVEDRPRLHRRDRRVVDGVEHAVRERRRAGGDRGLRVREVRARGPTPACPPRGPRRSAPRRPPAAPSADGAFGARHQAMSSSISLISAAPSAFASRTDRRRLLGRRGKAIQMAVGGLALVPPAALRREDRSGREARSGMSERSRDEARAPASHRHVLRHEAHRRDAPAQHRPQVLVGLRVHVGVDQPGEDPPPLGGDDLRSGRESRDRLRRRDAHGHDPALGDDEEGVSKRRRSRPVDERGPADGDRGGEQNGPAHARKTGPTWSRARALSRAPLPRSRPDRCP